MMKRINMYDEEGLCIGSIYKLSEKGMLVDIDNVYGLMWIKNAKAVDFESLSRFINGHKIVEIGVKFDTVEENYILRIKKKVLRIMDRHGQCIYKVKCTNAILEDDPDFIEDRTFFPKKTSRIHDEAEIKNSNHLNIFDGDFYLGTMYFFQDGRIVVDLTKMVGVFEIAVDYNIEMYSICNYINDDLGLIDLDAERIVVDSIWDYLDASPNPKDMDPKYKLTINNKKLSIIDKNGIIIYTRACNRAEEKTVEKCY